MAAANQYDRLNDPELGSGKFDTQPVEMKEPECLCGYGFLGMVCELHMTPEQAEEWRALDILVGYVPPEPYTENPETIKEAIDWTVGACSDDTWLAQCNDSGYGDFGPM